MSGVYPNRETRRRLGLTWPKIQKITTKIDGYFFQSKAEAEFYRLNKARLVDEDGDGGVHPSVKIEPGIRYKPDFRVRQPDGSVAYVDAKGGWGKDRSRFPLVKKLWRIHRSDNLIVAEYNHRTRRFFETIVHGTGKK